MTYRLGVFVAVAVCGASAFGQSMDTLAGWDGISGGRGLEGGGQQSRGMGQSFTVLTQSRLSEITFALSRFNPGNFLFRYVVYGWQPWPGPHRTVDPQHYSSAWMTLSANMNQFNLYTDSPNLTLQPGTYMAAVTTLGFEDGAGSADIGLRLQGDAYAGGNFAIAPTPGNVPPTFSYWHTQQWQALESAPPFRDAAARLTLTPVPEPATLAVVGLGTLWMARRRRR
jgi:hypothetical protein